MYRIFIISFLFLIGATTSFGQQLNKYGEKIVKEILVSYVKEGGVVKPYERYVYDYDVLNLDLIGINHYRNEHYYSKENDVLMCLKDSIRFGNGNLHRYSFNYNDRDNALQSTGREYRYTLNRDGLIAKVEVIMRSGEDLSRYDHTFHYAVNQNTRRNQLIKYEWDEWWYPEEDKKWFRQCYPEIHIVDYGKGLHAERQTNKSPEEMIDKMAKYVDFSIPYDLNIDITGILNDKFFFDPDFHCEQMTDWMPRRLNYYPKDCVDLFKYAPFEFVRDSQGNIVQIKGYWMRSNDTLPCNDYIVEIIYL